jgi:hypothetical protein
MAVRQYILKIKGKKRILEIDMKGICRLDGEKLSNRDWHTIVLHLSKVLDAFMEGFQEIREREVKE